MASQDRGSFNRIRASPISQKGGQPSQSQPGGKPSQQMGGQHSGGNLAKDPSRATDAGCGDGEGSGGSER